LIRLKQIVNGAVVSEIEMQAGEFSIGRNHGNSLQLDDGDVSGEHVLLSLKPKATLINYHKVLRVFRRTYSRHVP